MPAHGLLVETVWVNLQTGVGKACQYNQLIRQLEGIKLAGMLELNYIYLDVNKCILS